MSVVKLTKTEKKLRGFVQHYNEESYWKMRKYVENYNGGILHRAKALFYLYKIKKTDAFNNASLGTHLGLCAQFEDIPSFPHGLYGIIISHNAKIGKNCTIYHQVTIGSGAAVIGDNVTIGAGAKIIGNVTIGDDCRIGANAVITKDVPSGATVVPAEMRFIV